MNLNIKFKTGRKTWSDTIELDDKTFTPVVGEPRFLDLVAHMFKRNSTLERIVFIYEDGGRTSVSKKEM